MEIHRSVDSQMSGHVADHEQGTAASTVGLAQSGESHLSESMLQRFEAMETSIAAVSSSVRSLGVDHLLERLRALGSLTAATDSTGDCVRVNTASDLSESVERSVAHVVEVQAAGVPESQVKSREAVLLAYATDTHAAEGVSERVQAAETSSATLVNGDGDGESAEIAEADAGRITSTLGEHPLHPPTATDEGATSRRSKVGGLRASSIFAGSDADEGQRKSLNVSFDGGSQVHEITPGLRKSQSSLTFSVPDGSDVDTPEARLSQAEARISELVSTQRKSSLLVEVLLHQASERDRGKSIFSIRDAEDVSDTASDPTASRKSLHDWYKEMTMNVSMEGSDSDEEPTTRRSTRSSLKSLSGWLSDQVGLSPSESSSDSDDNARATPVGRLPDAFNSSGAEAARESCRTDR